MNAISRTQGRGAGRSRQRPDRTAASEATTARRIARSKGGISAAFHSRPPRTSPLPPFAWAITSSMPRSIAGSNMARRLRGAADRAGVGNTARPSESTEKPVAARTVPRARAARVRGSRGKQPTEATADGGVPAARLAARTDEPDGPTRGNGKPTAAPETCRRPAPAVLPRRAKGAGARVQDPPGAASAQRAVVSGRLGLAGAAAALPSTPTSRFHLTARLLSKEYLRGTLTLADGAAPLLEMVTTDEPPSGPLASGHLRAATANRSASSGSEL